MTESMVEIRSVTKIYERGKQKVEVLHGLSIDIPKGDCVALMGPSGSGKTTLLNLIGGLDQPTSGQISVGGSRIDQLSSGQLAHWRAHNVGFVFQFYNLMPVLTAEANVELPLLLTNLSSAQRKKNVAVALQVVGEPGTSLSSKPVKRRAVETVWLQASPRVKPMLISGTPSRLAPATSSLPGMVSCACPSAICR